MVQSPAYVDTKFLFGVLFKLFFGLLLHVFMKLFTFLLKVFFAFMIIFSSLQTNFFLSTRDVNTRLQLAMMKQYWATTKSLFLSNLQSSTANNLDNNRITDFT